VNRKYVIKHALSAILLLSLLGLVTISLLDYRINKTVETYREPVPPIATRKIIQHYGLPVRLSIPKLNIDAVVISVGITAAGNLDTPKNNDEVGWYKDGSSPGNEGSSVLNGHVGVGSRAVFEHLSQLIVGDLVVVVDDTGKAVSFRVREIKNYDKNEQPSEVFSSINGAHLNLITCTGAWQQDQRTYSKRLVVFTDKLL
jgi:sortase A